MFREMRRKRQALPHEECEAIIQKNTSGVLAVAGDEDYPYAVPISYVSCGEHIFFHSAKTGHKIDALKRNAKASLCVIDQDQVIPEEYTTYFRSVIVFGTIRLLEEEQEQWEALEKLALKYAPGDSPENRQRTIGREMKALCVLKMTREHMTGKEAIELRRTHP